MHTSFAPGVKPQNHGFRILRDGHGRTWSLLLLARIGAELLLELEVAANPHLSADNALVILPVREGSSAVRSRNRMRSAARFEIPELGPAKQPAPHCTHTHARVYMVFSSTSRLVPGHFGSMC